MSSVLVAPSPVRSVVPEWRIWLAAGACQFRGSMSLRRTDHSPMFDC
jgi:hypothetical protein